VGCKEDWELHKTEVQKRFTLTMWDVKASESSAPPLRTPRFTLTMWDVKEKPKWFIRCGFSFYLNYVGCKASRLAGDEGNAFVLP